MTIELNKSEIDTAVRAYIEKEYKMTPDKVSFNIRDTADDRFGGGPCYDLVSADVAIKSSK